MGILRAAAARRGTNQGTPAHAGQRAAFGPYLHPRAGVSSGVSLVERSGRS